MPGTCSLIPFFYAFRNDLARHGARISGPNTGKDLPVVEDGLRKGLTTGGSTQIGVETEGFVDREIGLAQ